MSYKGKKIAVVMPAYNAEKTLVATYSDLPFSIVDTVILVDDASRDRTVEIAKTLPMIVEAHPINRGYGGNQKTCYARALREGADIMVMVHPDHQYDPTIIPEMIRTMVDGDYWAVFGSRMMKREQALSGGMPRWKYIFNILLTNVGNIVLGTCLTELHSGFRAYDRRVFDHIDIEHNSDNFIFDTQIIIQLIEASIRIKEIPIATRYFPEASQIRLKACIRYGCGILYHLFLYKTGLRRY